LQQKVTGMENADGSKFLLSLNFVTKGLPDFEFSKAIS
jgi:hypothetical protein